MALSRPGGVAARSAPSGCDAAEARDGREARWLSTELLGSDAANDPSGRGLPGEPAGKAQLHSQSHAFTLRASLDQMCCI